MQYDISHKIDCELKRVLSEINEVYSSKDYIKVQERLTQRIKSFGSPVGKFSCGYVENEIHNSSSSYTTANIKITSKNSNYDVDETVRILNGVRRIILSDEHKDNCGFGRLEIPGSVLEIMGMSMVFNSAREVIFNDGVRIIQESAFKYGKSNFRQVQFPDSLEFIGKSAFSRCNLKGKIEIPNNVRVISDNAFDTCKNIYDISFGNNIKYIGKEVLHNTGIDGTVRFPESLIAVDLKDIFKSCGDIGEACVLEFPCDKLEYAGVLSDDETEVDYGETFSLKKVTVSHKCSIAERIKRTCEKHKIECKYS